MNPLRCLGPLPDDIALINDAMLILTPRQLEAVELYKIGCTQIEIAIELQITQQAVSRLLESAFLRLSML